MTPRLRIPDWALLAAFCGFFFLWKLASFGLIGADEPRYAQIAREMLERHDLITPTLGGSPWLEKPPLYYWQAMASYAVFGVSDWAARLPSVFDATLLVFAAYFFTRRLHREAAMDAALAMACAAGIAGYARAASTDMPLAAMFTVAMLAWQAWFEGGSRKYLAAFYIFLGLATLAKGPVAVLLAVIIIGVFAIVRQSGDAVTRSLWLPGILLFCLVALPWYALAQIKNPKFFRVFILQHNLARFGTNVFHHPEPFWYFVPVALLGWVPWTVFLIAALACAARSLRKKESDVLNTFLVIWIVVVVVFFSFSQSKLPGYVLPAVPPGILLFAVYLREKAGPKVNAGLLILHSVVIALLVFAAFILRFVVLRHTIQWNSAMWMPLTVAAGMGTLVAVALFKSGFAALRFVTIVPAVITLALALRLGAPALDETLSARAVSGALAKIAPQNMPIAGVMIPRELEFGLQFYRNRQVPRYELGQAPAGEHLVVAREGFRKAFGGNVPGRKIVYLGNFPAQNVEFYYVGPR